MNGNWTVEIAKSKLYQFMKMKDITPDCNFMPVAAGSSTNYVLVMKISLSDPELALLAREIASNKKLASKLCCLSLVTQLYSLGLIEAFNGSLKQIKPSRNGIQEQPNAKRTELTVKDEVVNERQLDVQLAATETSARSYGAIETPFFLKEAKFENQSGNKVSKAVDENCGYGNWTIENAKTRLHSFLQRHKMPLDYKYACVRHGSLFRAEIKFFVKKLKYSVSASGTGCTKRAASKDCADSMVQQLYRLGVIKAFMGKQKKNEVEKSNGLSTIEEFEVIDLEAAVRGHWTTENAKASLHHFMKINHISANYQYTVVKPIETISYTAEMEIVLNEGKHYVCAHGSGANKISASKSCALSMVHQLYDMGIIEAYTSPIKKKKKKSLSQQPTHESKNDTNLGREQAPVIVNKEVS
uniref:DRBM domain-containing protein n=1 Tax=Glossina pallidipes TaxID=7398 RepID=A0A1A9Z0E1_GLOPL